MKELCAKVLTMHADEAEASLENVLATVTARTGSAKVCSTKIGIREMKNFDHYAAATNIANQLRKEGLAEWAKKIQDSMGEGATGTEIFMILRSRIAELLLSEQGSPAVIGLSRELFSQLNDSLS